MLFDFEIQRKIDNFKEILKNYIDDFKEDEFHDQNLENKL